MRASRGSTRPSLQIALVAWIKQTLESLDEVVPDQLERVEEFLLGCGVDFFDCREEGFLRVHQVLSLAHHKLEALLLGRVLECGEVDVPQRLDLVLHTLDLIAQLRKVHKLGVGIGLQLESNLEFFLARLEMPGTCLEFGNLEFDVMKDAQSIIMHASLVTDAELRGMHLVPLARRGFFNLGPVPVPEDEFLMEAFGVHAGSLPCPIQRLQSPCASARRRHGVSRMSLQS